MPGECNQITDKCRPAPERSDPSVSRLASEKLTEGVGGLENHVYRFMGDPKTDKRLKKVLDLTGKKGDTFMVNAWGKGTWVNRTFTADQNHVAVVTDAEGNKTQYDWDTRDDLLKSLTDGCGNKLTYGYDSAKRLVSVSQDVTVNGVKQTVQNKYTYAKDRLSEIEHNGFKYGFAYDVYGNTSAASIAGTQVVSYQWYIMETCSPEVTLHIPGVWDANLPVWTMGRRHSISMTIPDPE